MEDMHVGRAFTGHAIEDECECPQQACGLVRLGDALADCPQHGFLAGRTMRQMHDGADCPGAEA